MEQAIVTVNGQMVIPASLRKKYKIDAGTVIRFREEKDGLKMIPVTPKTIDDNVGFLKTHGKLLKALMEDKQREREL